MHNWYAYGLKIQPKITHFKIYKIAVKKKKQQETHKLQEGTRSYQRGGMAEGGWGEREKGIER